MGEGKETALANLKKRFEDCSSKYYFDCTRDDLYGMVDNICKSTIQSKDYMKFVSSISTVLFRKVYVEGEVWEPTLITSLIDIVMSILDLEDTKTDFIPASAMIGENKLDADSIRSSIIEQFNNNVIDFNDEEMAEYIIKV